MTTVAERLEGEWRLDAAVKRVRELRAVGARAAYEVGQKLLEIHRERLWRLRTGHAGVPAVRVARWQTFEAFCKGELGYSSSHARGLMTIAETYDVDDFDRYGTNGLLMLARTPPEEERVVRRMLDEGRPHREVRGFVKRAKETYQHRLPARDGRSMGFFKGAGRPATTMLVRLKPDELRRAKERASAEGMSVSEWAAKAIVAALG